MPHKRQVAPFIQTDENCYESLADKRLKNSEINKALVDYKGTIQRLPEEQEPPRTLVSPRTERDTPPTAGFVGLWEEQGERD